MKLLASLTNRIFLTSAALAVVSIGSAVFFVSRITTREAEAELQRGLIEAGTLVDQHRATRVQTFIVMARNVADLPKLKAAVDTNDPPTVKPEAANYQQQIGSDLLVVTNRSGDVLFASGLEASPAAVASLPEIKSALSGREASGFWPQSNGVLQVVTVPIFIGLEQPEILGTLSVGFQLDNALADEFKRLTESDIAFAVDGAIRASTLAAADQPQLASLLGSEGVSTVSLNGSEYVALLRPLSLAPSTASPGPAAEAGVGVLRQARPSTRSASAGSKDARAPTAIILRSRTERLRFLDAIHTGLAVLAIVTVLLATILSYAVARTVTRPLAAITDTMREMATTGDLTRKVPIRGSGSWEDEDARLLATTFNTLTDSIARFQREATQRERLSSLGRLSTVIAHEIRNPLMIIKGSLRTLRREQHATQEETRQALTDVDEEVARLNRVVNDVLDFARPIRFDYAPADLNAVCTEAVAASREADPEASVRIEVDPKLTPVVTDAERLRTALVNILTNARHAVAARSSTLREPQDRPESGRGTTRSERPVLRPAQHVPSLSRDERAEGRDLGASQGSSGAPDIELRTLQTMNGGGSARIIIRDRGIGIRPEDLPRIFDPYFTTKRTGSGLGLAIAKNIIEGMGASITLESRAGEGTEIRIDLPMHPKEAV